MACMQVAWSETRTDHVNCAFYDGIRGIGGLQGNVERKRKHFIIRRVYDCEPSWERDNIPLSWRENFPAAKQRQLSGERSLGIVRHGRVEDCVRLFSGQWCKCKDWFVEKICSRMARNLEFSLDVIGMCSHLKKHNGFIGPADCTMLSHDQDDPVETHVQDIDTDIDFHPCISVLSIRIWLVEQRKEKWLQMEGRFANQVSTLYFVHACLTLANSSQGWWRLSRIPAFMKLCAALDESLALFSLRIQSTLYRGRHSKSILTFYRCTCNVPVCTCKYLYAPLCTCMQAILPDYVRYFLLLC